MGVEGRGLRSRGGKTKGKASGVQDGVRGMKRKRCRVEVLKI